MHHTLLTLRLGIAAALTLAFWGCVTPAHPRAAAPILLEPHAEPDLVTEGPAGPGTGTGTATGAQTSGQRQSAPVVVTHTVEAGQTLYRIARTYEITVDDLMKANGITDPRTLAVGQVLTIPGATAPRPIVPPGAQEASPAAGNTGSAGVASRPRAAPSRTSSRPRDPVVMPKGPGVLEWPLRGVLYARYGKKGRERHDGIDLAAPLGTPVKTARAGKVLYAGEQKGYGLIVIVDHGGDLITLYAHNRDLRVKTGQKVRDGQVIATVGESGRTSGPHLHFEVRRGGIPVDPLSLLGAPPGQRRALGRR